MNLELEQRRTEYEKRSRQLEGQSRYTLVDTRMDLQSWHYTETFACLQGDCRAQGAVRNPIKPECQFAAGAAAERSLDLPSGCTSTPPVLSLRLLSQQQPQMLLVSLCTRMYKHYLPLLRSDPGRG